MPRESSIVVSIKKRVNAMPRCRTIKLHGGEYSVAGTPDLTGCCDGRSFWIEVKRPGEKVTPKQAHELDLWLACNALVGVARSADDAIAILNGDREWPRDQ